MRIISACRWFGIARAFGLLCVSVGFGALTGGCGGAPPQERGASKQAASEASRCEIHKPTGCPRHPSSLGGTLLHDGHEGSNTNVHRCMQRAQEYHSYCGFGGSASQAVTAKYFSGGRLIAERTAPGGRCEIHKPAGCPQNPASFPETLLFDEYQQANTDQQRCLRRAQDYHDFCGFAYAADQAVTARFFSGGLSLSQRTAPGNRCEIHKPAGCPNYGAASFQPPLVFDNYQGSDVDVARCKQRAQNYHDFCGFERSVTAKAYADGVLVDEARSINRCAVGFRRNATGTCVLADGLQPRKMAPDEATTVGTLPGKVVVSKLGQATYSLPLAVPPGTAGVQPELALGYDGSRGDGLLGVGWQLSGLSAITRCGQTLAQDGKRAAVNFTASDRFCLDGQRLVAVSGVYGADGTEYRTERETFVRVISHGSQSSGPRSFTVYHRDGRTVGQYGTHAEARVLAGTKGVETWLLRQVNVGDSYYRVHYAQADGSYWPAHIAYTGHQGAHEPFAVIRFVYTHRPNRLDGYVHGRAVMVNRLLQRIEMESENQQGWHYLLVYEDSPATGRPRLKALQRGRGSSVAMPPTSFSYQGSAVSYGVRGDLGAADGAAESQVLDLNGDGFSDLVYAANGALMVRLGSTSGLGGAINTGHSDEGWRVATAFDYDHDPRADLLLPRGGTLKVLSMVGTNTFRWRDTAIAVPASWSSVVNDTRLCDLLHRCGFYDWGDKYCPGDNTQCSRCGVIARCETITTTSEAIPFFVVAELDGDGRPDLLVLTPSPGDSRLASLTAHLRTSTGFSARPTANISGIPWVSLLGQPAYENHPLWRHKRILSLTDIDGDGVSEVIPLQTTEPTRATTTKTRATAMTPTATPPT